MSSLTGIQWLLVALFVAGPAFMSAARAADYAPLDCKKEGSAPERTVCSDYGLGQSEARVATLYQIATSLVAMGQRAQLQDEQRAFIKQRDTCGFNAGCIRGVYAERIAQLEAVMAGIAQRGPF
ncbi:hypothetical protein BH10PSE10_BH10PSE10_20730 [soil metagenome]